MNVSEWATRAACTLVSLALAECPWSSKVPEAQVPVGPIQKGCPLELLVLGKVGSCTLNFVQGSGMQAARSQVLNHYGLIASELAAWFLHHGVNLKAHVIAEAQVELCSGASS